MASGNFLQNTTAHDNLGVQLFYLFDSGINAYRPANKDDFAANVSVSGLTVGNVGITGIQAQTSSWFQLNLTTSATPAAPTQVTGSSTQVRRVLLYNVEGSGSGIYIGPNSSANYKQIYPSEEYLIEAPVGRQFDLSNWYIKSSGVSQAMNVLLTN